MLLAAELASDADTTVEEECKRTPRQLPDIWPDMRAKPPRRIMDEDDINHMGDLAAKFRVRGRPPTRGTRALRTISTMPPFAFTLLARCLVVRLVIGSLSRLWPLWESGGQKCAT